jgi:hypothetical protein
MIGLRHAAVDHPSTVGTVQVAGSVKLSETRVNSSPRQPTGSSDTRSTRATGG